MSIFDLYSLLIKHDKMLRITFNLLNLYLTSKQNHCKYSEVHIRHKLNLFVDTVLRLVCLTIDVAAE